MNYKKSFNEQKQKRKSRNKLRKCIKELTNINIKKEL